MAKRIVLFVLTNILIMATLTIVLNVLGLDVNYYTNGALNYQSLMVFCLVWGMGGSFISLLMSKQMAKWMMGVQIVDPNTTDPTAQALVSKVHRMAQGAGLSKMPEVGFYNSPEVNAFATGPSKNNSLVAVSDGLLKRLSDSEVEGVIGHEVAHIANGDMVTMTLVQGVVNAFVMFFARIAAHIIGSAMSRDDEGPNPFVSFGLVMLFQIVFGFLGMIVVGYFSRMREFRADAGGAQLAGRGKMIAALERLKGTAELIDTEHQAMASLKIAGKWGALFSTHPPLEARIERLKRYGAAA